MPQNSTIKDAIRDSDFVLTAQLQLNEETGRKGVIAQAKGLAESVNGVSVPANPHGVVHMSGLAASAILLEQGVDPMLHIASRDRNRISIRSELLGAVALGVTSLFLERGDKVSHTVRPRAKKNQPSKVGSVKMLKVAKRLSDYQIEQNESELLLGTLATVVEPGSDWAPHGITTKVDAGARFLKTRPCCDAELVRRYATRLVEIKFVQRCRIIVSIPVLPNLEAAEWINKHRETEVIPVAVRKRLAEAASPRDEGIQIAAELLQELAKIPGISGANLITQGDIESIPAAIAAAGL